MKKNWLFICAIGAILAIAATLAADDQKPNAAISQPELAELKQQFGALQAQVQALEQKLDKLEKQKSAAVPGSTPLFLFPSGGKGAITLPKYSAPIASDFADPNRPPKIWGEGECNGWKYYNVPLSYNPGGE